MTDKSNMALIVTTIITVAGGIAVAIINQQGKTDKARDEQVRVERERTPDAPEKAPPEVERSSAPPVRVEPRQAADDREVADRSDDAPPVTTPRNPLGDGPKVSALLGVVDVSGPWHDAGHQPYTIEQTGAQFRITGPLFPVGMPGTVGNGGVRWQFTEASGNSGICSGPLNGTRLDLSCVSGAGTVGMQFHRPNT